MDGSEARVEADGIKKGADGTGLFISQLPDRNRSPGFLNTFPDRFPRTHGKFWANAVFPTPRASGHRRHGYAAAYNFYSKTWIPGPVPATDV